MLLRLQNNFNIKFSMYKSVIMNNEELLFQQNVITHTILDNNSLFNLYVSHYLFIFLKVYDNLTRMSIL